MASVPFFGDQSATDLLRRSGSAGGQITQAGPPGDGPDSGSGDIARGGFMRSEERATQA